jgi:hypothetical protein
MKSIFLLLGVSMVLVFPMSAKAATGWITAIYNEAPYEYNLRTNDVPYHRGEIHKGSLHCDKKVKDTYSNWNKKGEDEGRYRICKNDELKVSKMGIPWGPSKMIRIWNKTKLGDETPTGKDNSVQIYIASCKTIPSYDCLHITDGHGVELDSKKEVQVGLKNLISDIEFNLTFEKDGTFTFTPVNEGWLTSSLANNVAKYLDDNKELVVKILEAKAKK